MRMLKVDMHKEVLRFLRHECSAADRESFQKGLEAVRTLPIESSGPYHDPEIRPHMLRYFRFGQNRAIFEYHPAKDLIVIWECRKRDQQRRKPT